MADSMIVREILETYEEVLIDSEIVDDLIFMISLFGKHFLFIAPTIDNPGTYANVYLYNDDGLDFPHIMLREKSFPDIQCIPEGKYRWVCLYEQDSIVNTIVSYEDKVIDALDRLIELLSMTTLEKEKEFQKEFMFYWNSNSVDTMDHAVFLSQENAFAEMNIYFGQSKARIVEKGLYLSDINSRVKDKRKWVPHVENNVYFIPISDCREILPPHRGYAWSAKDVKSIVYAKQIEHISDETYRFLRTTIPQTQNVILVFGMKTEQVNAVFALKLKCNNLVRCSLLEKILNNTVSVELLYTHREDYLYLNEQIGNDVGLLKKKVLLIGAGSLGSYVAFELAKNGVSALKVYDEDKLENENVLRWAYGGFGTGINKAEHIALLLNILHPEIKVEAVGANIDNKKLAEEVSQVDLIIFTVGNSDVQLRLNRDLHEMKCSVPVVYAWIEAGGTYSHILVVDYRKPGCFECLYTSKAGILTNNRARKDINDSSDNYIVRNGCGGTRAAYGTAVLLRTTAAILEVIQKISDQYLVKNTLIDISPEKSCESKIEFPLEACNCCGNKKNE